MRHLRFCRRTPVFLRVFSLYNGLHGISDTEKEEESESRPPPSETNKYCPSGALFQCPRTACNIQNELHFRSLALLPRSVRFVKVYVFYKNLLKLLFLFFQFSMFSIAAIKRESGIKVLI